MNNLKELDKEIDFIKSNQLMFNIGNLKWLTFQGEYYYTDSLQTALDELLNVNLIMPNKNHSDTLEAINYFKNNLMFVYKVIEKELKPFLDIDLATRCSAERLLKSFPDATSDIINEKQLNLFAGIYLKDKVQGELLKLYKQIKNYSQFICNNYLTEE